MYLLHPYVCMHLLVCVCMHACMYTTTTVSMRCVRHMSATREALAAGRGAWGVSLYIIYIGDPPMSRMSQGFMFPVGQVVNT